MTRLTINTANAITSGKPVWSGSLIARTAASNSGSVERSVPAFISADEAYYWSFNWQEDVRESMDALKAGDYEEFDSDDPNDVARWLLTVDDDED
jgi:hypothetical protein